MQQTVGAQCVRVTAPSLAPSTRARTSPCCAQLPRAVRGFQAAPTSIRRATRLHAVTSGGSPSEGDSDGVEAMRQQLERSMDAGTNDMTGSELWALCKQKWGRSYDIRLVRRGKNMFVHVMWKFLEQQSFPLTPEEYEEQLDAVSAYLNHWGCADLVRREIMAAKKHPGYNVGGGASAVSIRLEGVTVGMGEF